MHISLYNFADTRLELCLPTSNTFVSVEVLGIDLKEYIKQLYVYIYNYIIYIYTCIWNVAWENGSCGFYFIT